MLHLLALDEVLLQVGVELGINYIDSSAFPDHEFYSADGKKLEVSAQSLGGKFFTGDSVDHMVEDNTPQGDDSGSNIVLYAAVIIAAVILVIAAAFILKKRKA